MKIRMLDESRQVCVVSHDEAVRLIAAGKAEPIAGAPPKAAPEARVLEPAETADKPKARKTTRRFRKNKEK